MAEIRKGLGVETVSPFLEEKVNRRPGITNLRLTIPPFRRKYREVDMCSIFAWSTRPIPHIFGRKRPQ
jgi:hypothetical protein